MSITLGQDINCKSDEQKRIKKIVKERSVKRSESCNGVFGTKCLPMTTKIDRLLNFENKAQSLKDKIEFS